MQGTTSTLNKLKIQPIKYCMINKFSQGQILMKKCIIWVFTDLISVGNLHITYTTIILPSSMAKSDILSMESNANVGCMFLGQVTVRLLSIKAISKCHHPASFIFLCAYCSTLTS